MWLAINVFLRFSRKTKLYFIFKVWKGVLVLNEDWNLGGGGDNLHISRCRDVPLVWVLFWGCSLIFGYLLGYSRILGYHFFGYSQILGYHFFGYSRILGYHFFGYCRILGHHFFGYSRIFGYHFLVKFDFFRNNSDFWVLILIFPSMTLWNVACRALVSVILQFSLLFCYVCAKSSGNVVNNSFQFEFVYLQCFLILTSFYHCG